MKQLEDTLAGLGKQVQGIDGKLHTCQNNLAGERDLRTKAERDVVWWKNETDTQRESEKKCVQHVQDLSRAHDKALLELKAAKECGAWNRFWRNC